MYLDRIKSFFSAIIIFVAFTLLYSSTHSPLLGAAHDSIYYLRSIESGKSLLHPHHLLYNPVARFWIKQFNFTDTVFGIELLNAIAGGATIALLFILLKNKNSILRAVFWTSIYAFSFGTWFYSATIEVYILPLPFLLAALILNPDKKWSAFLLGLLTSIATLFHQTNLLFLPCGLWRLRRSGIRGVATYLLVTAILVGGSYLAAGSIQFSSAQDNIKNTMNWSTKYMHELDLGKITPTTPMKILIGAGRFFVGAHFVFATDFAPRLGEYHLEDEKFLVRNIDHSYANLLLTASILWFIILTLALIKLKASGSIDRNSFTEAMIAFVPYALFFSWWEPANVEFWIVTIMFAVIALSALTKMQKFSSKDFLFLTIPIFLALINYFGSISFLIDSKNDWYLKEALKHQDAVPGSIIELDDDWIIGPYIERNTGAIVIKK